MIMLWLSVLFLHRGCKYALAPVTSVHLGEPANISCALPFAEVSRMELHWYRQRVGDKLQRIVTLWQSTTPKYEPEFSESRWEITVGGNLCNLTITKTVEEDEGTYHCAFVEWINTEWSATYLLVKGKYRTSHFTVQQSMVSESIVLGEPVTFECSVLSENKVCSGDLSVFWLRGGSQASQPDVIYTDANSWDECGRRSDTQRSCVYRFSKTLTSSDAGIYYCAVATCGQIVFGNGTEMDFKGDEIETNKWHIVGLVCNFHFVHSFRKQLATWIYSAAVFTIMKHRKGSNRLQKAAEREKIFTAVKAFGLDQ
uniref:Ig-like domain-containing protein n=1 Tax=Salarias fasciatus TaxID=181472 RepID=A0A672IR82_SALFA